MKQYAQHFAEWFNARNERERMLIIVVVVVALVSFWVVLISDPQSLQRQQLQLKLTNLNKQHQGVQAQIDAIMQRAQQDPNEKHKQNIQQLLTEIGDINASLQQKMRGFIDPGRMAKVLEDVLRQDSKMTLIRLQSLPAERVFAETQPEHSKEEAGLYRHAFKMELHGSYLNTLDYVKALQELPWDFYWDGIDVEVVKYPQVKIVLQLHTLSLKEGWIGV